MALFPLKPTSTCVEKYYAALAQLQAHGHTTEGNTRSAFADLIKRAAGPYDWHLVEEYQFKGTAKQPLRRRNPRRLPHPRPRPLGGQGLRRRPPKRDQGQGSQGLPAHQHPLPVMNIESPYMERIGQYKSFEGICLVDTFELAEPKQAGFAFISLANIRRVMRQQESDITVIIGNPPYNAGQDEENDNNKNRPYPELGSRIQNTYSRVSRARNRNSLRDPYIKAFRWASDRLEGEGIVAFVTNSKFVHGKATNGMRLHLEQGFDKLYVLDLGGDVRSDTRLSGTTHNVFGIQAGVAICLLAKHRPRAGSEYVNLAILNQRATSREKLKYLEEHSAM